VWRKAVELRYYSEDPIKLYYKNENTTEKRECYVELEGELS